MDDGDYVRQSFVELMQRGIEVDVQPSSDVRIMWLGVDGKTLYVAQNKDSLAKTIFDLKKSEVHAKESDEYECLSLSGSTTLEIVSGFQRMQCNVDTETSRDILVRNLNRVITAALAPRCSIDETANASWFGLDKFRLLWWVLAVVAIVSLEVAGVSVFVIIKSPEHREGWSFWLACGSVLFMVSLAIMHSPLSKAKYNKFATDSSKHKVFPVATNTCAP